MPEINSWNAKIIEEFRANEGKVGGQFQGAPVLLLTTTGKRTGVKHTTPMMYRRGDNDAETLYVFASKAGADTHPDWYHNLIANPAVTVEVGTEMYEATATAVTGEDRDRIYAEHVAVYPGFGEYQEKTTRVIPVVALHRQQ